MGCNSSSATSDAEIASSGRSGGVVFGYFGNIRGGPRGNGTKFLLNYCKVTYTDKYFSIDERNTVWKAYKESGDIPFANLPYLTDGGIKISQCLAV